MLSKLEFVKIDFSFAQPWVFGDSTLSDKWFSTSVNQTNSHLNYLRYSSGSFINNYAFYFVWLASTAALHLLHNVLYRYIWCAKLDDVRAQASNSHKLKCVQRIRVNVFKYFHLGVYINSFWEGLVFMLLNILNEIWQADTSTTFALVSLASSWISLVVVLSIAVLVWFRVACKDKHNETGWYSNALYRELDVSDPVWRAYYVSFIARRVATCVVLIVLTNPKSQWLTYFGIQCLSLMYSVFQRPFESTANNLNMMFCDLTLVVVAAWVLSMPEDGTSDYDSKLNENKGMVCCSIIMFCNLMLVITVSQILKRFRQSQATSSTFANEMWSQSLDASKRLRSSSKTSSRRYRSLRTWPRMS